MLEKRGREGVSSSTLDMFGAICLVYINIGKKVVAITDGARIMAGCQNWLLKDCF